MNVVWYDLLRISISFASMIRWFNYRFASSGQRPPEQYNIWCSLWGCSASTHDWTITPWELWETCIKYMLLFFCKREKNIFTYLHVPYSFIQKSQQLKNNFHPQIINMILDVIFGLSFIGFLYFMFLLYFWSKLWECENCCLCEKEPKEEIFYGPFPKSHYREFDV